MMLLLLAKPAKVVPLIAALAVFTDVVAAVSDVEITYVVRVVPSARESSIERGGRKLHCFSGGIGI